MSHAASTAEAFPRLAGGALPNGAPSGAALPGAALGAARAPLLGMVQRLVQTAMAMARCLNGIAQQGMLGRPLPAWAPETFNPTMTNAFVVMAVALSAALRRRLFASVLRPVLVAPLADLGPEQQGPHGPMPAKAASQARADDGMIDWYGRGDPAIAGEDAARQYAFWQAYAQPVRVGPKGVAVAVQQIDGLSDAAVVAQICDHLRRAAEQLGAEADIARIDALEKAAKALCPPPEGSTPAAPDPEAAVSDAATPEAGRSSAVDWTPPQDWMPSEDRAPGDWPGAPGHDPPGRRLPA